jgi:hypothetical protein
LKPSEKLGIAVLLSLLTLLGIYVEIRSALLDRRMGDFGCYVRGAWAVWSGNKLYDVVENNGWHYNYPPFLAIMFVPMADPPTDALPAPFISYAVAVGLWFVFSLVCLACAIHVLASAIEETSKNPEIRNQPRGCRRWWALRITPLLVCLIPIGHTFMRGQVNTVILAMLCAMIAAFLRKQDFRAGLWLALATSIKVIPIYLVVYPLVRRNWRALAGWCLGLEITLVVLPFLVWGPAESIDVYQDWANTLLGPAFGMSEDKSREDELLGKGLTDNQSLKSAPFNVLHPNINERPTKLPAWAEWNHRIAGLLLTAITLAAGFRSGFRSDWSQVALLGSLIFLMCVLSPVCHLHYFTYMLPLVMALLAQRWEFRRDLDMGPLLVVLLSLMFFANLLPQLPRMELVLRDVGLPLYVGLGIWFLAMRRLWGGERMIQQSVEADTAIFVRAA